MKNITQTPYLANVYIQKKERKKKRKKLDSIQRSCLYVWDEKDVGNCGFNFSTLRKKNKKSIKNND